MKVLQINSHFNNGGAGKIVSCLHDYYCENDITSSVIYGRGAAVNNANVYRIGSDLSNKIDALTTRLVGSAGTQSILATRQAIEIIDKLSPSILHLHGLHGYYLNYKILFDYINDNNIPCVWTFHDCLAFTGKCGYPYSCSKYIDGCNHCTLLKDYPTTYGFDLTKQMWKQKQKLFTESDNKIIVSPSEWMTQMAKTSFFKRYECITINNGIDTHHTFFYRDKKLIRKELGFNEDEKIALGVAFGQENPRKGVQFIIQAAKSLPDITFVLIGWKNNNNVDIEGMNNIRTKAFINDQDELARYYACADVFLLPSLAENYATTAIESLACGTPVIGFNVGGIPEQANGIFGDTVPVGNQIDFNNKIQEWCNRASFEDEKRKMRSEIIKEKNSIKRMAEDYISIYSRLI